MIGISIPLLIVAFYGWWHNRQVDKYEEWKKQQEALNDSPESV
jgi:hypothetical protein